MSERIPPNFDNQGEYFPIESTDSIEAAPKSNLLEIQNQLLDGEIKAALANKIEEVSSVELPPSTHYTIARLTDAVKGVIDYSGFDSMQTVVGTPNRKNPYAKNADLALNVGSIAKIVNSSPQNVAENVATGLATIDDVKEASVAGSFVNIELDYQRVAPRIFEEVRQFSDHYGHFRDGDPEVVVIDYSSPNVAKNMTVAHLRSTIIGQSLMKIHEAAGDVSFGINHIGDWGTQFGNIIYQYDTELAERDQGFLDELDADPTATLMRLYRDFNARKDSDPQAVKAAQDIFLRLEQGEPELVQLWDQFRDWSLGEFTPTYDRLGIKFDGIQGESFYEDRMKPVIEDAVARGVLRTNEEGAIVLPGQPLASPTTGKINDKVMLGQDGQLRDEIIVKPSGGTVYLTRDLAAIRYRGKELGADKILYVIGKEQQTHCLKLFAMADQLDYAPLGSAEHVSFGHLNIEGSKMKSRQGKVVLLNEVLDEATEAAIQLITVRKNESDDYSELSDRELAVAKQVGISAVIFNDLKQNREKDIEFDPDIARTLEAGSSAYIQYTHTRLTGILEKVGEPEVSDEVPESLHASEKVILADIAFFPKVIQEAAQRNTPHRIATYLTELCQSVNLFYHDQPVGKAASPTERNFRLQLVKSAQQVIKNGAYLLHIDLPERM
jgi:arginyl-tRNA synthetase